VSPLRCCPVFSPCAAPSREFANPGKRGCGHTGETASSALPISSHFSDPVADRPFETPQLSTSGSPSALWNRISPLEAGFEQNSLGRKIVSGNGKANENGP
jgi:hypothetical protein